MAVFDAFTYNGEREVLKIHLNILDKYVDTFIICEAKTTFSGIKKPLYFFRDQRWFRKWWHKIEYYVIDENYSPDELLLAQTSPNTQGATHWKREFLQKEAIKKALSHAKLQDDDLCLIGDVDEIIDPTATYESDKPFKARLRVYAYYLNNESDEQFWGTLVAQYKDIKNNCLNHMRSDTKLYSKGDPLGWHFTSMGGEEEVRRKLNDSYTKESYNTDEVQQNLKDRFSQRKDYLGRPFNFKALEEHLPPFLKENKAKYKHLWLP